MATRYGRNIAGTDFHICESQRMGRPLISYFVDGKKVSVAEYTRKIEAAKKARAAQEAGA
jgi:hypothetical protein